MVSTETWIISGCTAAAVLLFYAVETYADLPGWFGLAVLIGVGIVLPAALTNWYKNRGADDGDPMRMDWDEGRAPESVETTDER